MRIAVAGATGAAGTPIVAELERQGHEVRALSRRSPTYPVDLLSGDGLDHALEGCEVLVDASNAGPKIGEARALLVDAGKLLLTAEKRAGVRHHVCLSIVGINGFPLGYYRVKVEQERGVREGPVPWSIVRATQFHSFVAANFASMARLGLLPRIAAPLQPVDVIEVAALVAEVAVGSPTATVTTIAGPAARPIAELARAWKTQTGSRALRTPIPLPGAVGRSLKAGALTDPSPDRRGSVTFEQGLFP